MYKQETCFQIVSDVKIQLWNPISSCSLWHRLFLVTASPPVGVPTAPHRAKTAGGDSWRLSQPMGEWVSRYFLYVNLKNKLGNTSSYWGFVYCPALYPPNPFKHTQSFQTFPFLHIFGPALATVIWTYFKPRSENTKDQLLTQLISHYSGNQTLRGLNSCKPMHSCAHKPQFL